MPRKTLTIIGIFLIFIQISGVPHLWKTVFGIFAGIYLIIIAMRGVGNSENNSEFRNKIEDDISSVNDSKKNMMSYDSESINKEN